MFCYMNQAHINLQLCSPIFPSIHRSLRLSENLQAVFYI